MRDTQYIGHTVNRLRKSADMTLKDLSDATGLSQGFLSKFERGQTTIAVDSLLQVAAALGTTVEHLTTPEESVQTPELPKVVHHSYENSVLFLENGNIHYQISDGVQEMDVLPKRIVLLPSSRMEPAVLSAHQGQEFIYVLEGVLTLEIQGEVSELYPGDTAHFHSDIEHDWYNNTNRNTVILTVHTPNVLAAEA